MGRYGLDGLSPTESGLVKTADVLFMRFLFLGASMFEASELLDLLKSALVMEQLDDPESYL